MDSPGPTHLSLCAGYDGLGLALQRVWPTCRTVAYVEVEAFCVANLVAKMEEGQMAPAPIFTDLRAFDAKPFRGLVDIASGGFPCQPFSLAGQKFADQDPRHIFPDIIRTVRAIQPGLVLLENVSGILTAKLKGDEWDDPAGTPVLLHVLRSLERVGYKATAGVFTACEVGAPHERKRVFILARRSKAPLDATDDCFGASLGEIGDRAHSQSELADADRALLQRRISRRKNSGREDFNGLPRCRDSSVRTKWPVGPGHHQHKWEEPRTIPTQPKLGGTVDGTASGVDATANRVDRLRLLGNGVVVESAERALRVLLDDLGAGPSDGGPYG